MNVRNCRKCGKIFNYLSGLPICDNCKRKMEEQFQVVKAYIRSHPGTNIKETSEECEVETSLIKQWIREERLELEGSDGEIVCENCGKAISTGRLCEECKKTMANGFEDSIKKPEMPKPEPKKPDVSSGNKMRFLRH